MCSKLIGNRELTLSIFVSSYMPMKYPLISQVPYHVHGHILDEAILCSSHHLHQWVFGCQHVEVIWVQNLGVFGQELIIVCHTALCGRKIKWTTSCMGRFNGAAAKQNLAKHSKVRLQIYIFWHEIVQNFVKEYQITVADNSVTY